MQKKIGYLAVVASFVGLAVSEGAQLQPETLAGWKGYVEQTEARIQSELSAEDGFLVQDFLPDDEARRARRLLRSGEVFTTKLETRDATGRSIQIPNGMVHHWLGSVFIPGARVSELLEWLQDYDAHYRYYDEVESSRLVSRNGDDFEMFLRLKWKKIVTVYYNTDHRVHYARYGKGRASSVSIATRIAEISDAGTPQEKERPVGNDRGFLWRLNSYWRFEEAWGGVIVELESVSLSRGVPFAIRWLVGRYLDSVPRDSLKAMLVPIRNHAPRTLVTDRATVLQVGEARKTSARR